MRRPAYGMVVGVALLMGLTAVLTSQALDERLRDPDGFLGPAWVRLPAMLLGAFLIDIVPRSIYRSRDDLRSFSRIKAEARALREEHWTRDRVALVVIGLTCFYITYVSYRNLKNYLPTFFTEMKDPVLHQIDLWVFLGHEPATVLHQVFGESWAAQFFAFIYLLYLPLAPIALVTWLVWSSKVSYGYWFATANCLNWALGTISYYLIPTMGPTFWYPWLYRDLDVTGVTELQDSLWNSRQDVRFALNPFSDSVQSVAGFASLHVSLTLIYALMAHYTVRHALLRWAAWTFFGLTVVSTLYFGWHYVADDIGGVVIAVLAVWLGGIATGQKFERYGLSIRSTTDSAEVPVEPDEVADDAENRQPERT